MSEQNPNPSNNNFPNMKPNNQKPNRWRWVSWLLYSVAFFLLAMWMFGDETGSAASKELSYTKFVAYIENTDGTTSAKETVANDRFEAARKLKVSVKYVQLSTRKN